MRKIISPLDGIRSPFGRAIASSTPPGPTGNGLIWGTSNYFVWGTDYLIWGSA